MLVMLPVPPPLVYDCTCGCISLVLLEPLYCILYVYLYIKCFLCAIVFIILRMAVYYICYWCHFILWLDV